MSAPSAPNGLAVEAIDSNRIDLIWNDTADNEQGFKIERKTGSGGTYSQITTVASDVESYSDTTSLTEGTDYYYQVRAYNGVGDSDYSAEDNTTTSLASPTGLAALAVSETQINLTWTDNSSLETGFEIQRRTGSESFTQIATPSADAVSYSDTTLNRATTYHYQIRSSGGALSSAFVQTSAKTKGGGGGGSSGGCFLSTMVVQ